MTTLADLCELLDAFAPPRLAADWDNVGLLVGDRLQKVSRVMTCLTVTPAVAAEAIRERADLIVTHHPLPFRPLNRLTTDDPTGRLLLDLIRAGIGIYSPHTAFDSAARGINQQLAEGLGLTDIRPLVPADDLGAGRWGRLAQPQSLGQIAARVKQFLKISQVATVGDLQRPIANVAIACGSGGELLDAAIAAKCDVFLTGEARLHTCYEAEARGIAFLLAGHYASERFGVEKLAEILAAQFPSLSIWASCDERDPIVML
jgi:dinuclear metal center YbgI/SA1388 family protein